MLKELNSIFQICDLNFELPFMSCTNMFYDTAVRNICHKEHIKGWKNYIARKGTINPYVGAYLERTLYGSN